MNRNELKNETNKREALGVDNGEVADLLGALPRVEAPENFEFGVKAKIAAGNSHTSLGILRWIKVAAPVGLVLLIAAFVVFYGLAPATSPVDNVAKVEAPAGDQAAPPSPVVNNYPSPAAPVEAPVSTRDSEPLVTEKPREGTVASAPSAPVRQPTRSQANSTEAPGGSRDVSQSVPGVISPRGFETNVDTAEVLVDSLFQMLGVTAELVGGDWTVRSTLQNSLAAKAGMRPNDVIEAIDDHSLSGRTKIKGLRGGKSCLIRRDGKQLRVSLTR
jgi:hypothetical protein